MHKYVVINLENPSRSAQVSVLIIVIIGWIRVDGCPDALRFCFSRLIPLLELCFEAPKWPTHRALHNLLFEGFGHPHPYTLLSLLLATSRGFELGPSP